MVGFALKFIRPFARIFLKIGGRKILKTMKIDETKFADSLVVKLLGDDMIYEVDGFKLKKGRTTRLPILTGEVDPSITALIKKEVKKGMNVFDLGANFGWFTLILSKQVGESGHVYSFEADPTQIETLNENVSLNNLSNVTIVPFAVSNKSGITKFSLNESYDTRGQLESNLENQNKIDVNTISIDEFCEKNNLSVDFIKMDIEGSEPKAIEGMRKSIQLNPKIRIITEFNKGAISAVNESAEKFIDSLEQLGFTIQKIDEKIPGLFESIKKDELLKSNVCNLFCFKNEF